jgi:hypothetical protein
LGYRITAKFVQAFFGRVFDSPSKVFDEQILRPELQDREAFIDGVKNITEAQQRVAKQYLQDGSIEDAVPPLKALLTIMATGNYEGKDAHNADIRNLFTEEYLLKSDWYKKRLQNKQKKDIALWKRHVAYLESYSQSSPAGDDESPVDVPTRLSHAKAELEKVSAPAYLESLIGTLGADPSAG